MGPPQASGGNPDRNPITQPPLAPLAYSDSSTLPCVENSVDWINANFRNETRTQTGLLDGPYGARDHEPRSLQSLAPDYGLCHPTFRSRRPRKTQRPKSAFSGRRRLVRPHQRLPIRTGMPVATRAPNSRNRRRPGGQCMPAARVFERLPSGVSPGSAAHIGAPRRLNTSFTASDAPCVETRGGAITIIENQKAWIRRPLRTRGGWREAGLGRAADKRRADCSTEALGRFPHSRLLEATTRGNDQTRWDQWRASAGNAAYSGTRALLAPGMHRKGEPGGPGRARTTANRAKRRSVLPSASSGGLHGPPFPRSGDQREGRLATRALREVQG